MEFDAMRDYLLACGDEPEWLYTGLVIDYPAMERAAEEIWKAVAQLALIPNSDSGEDA